MLIVGAFAILLSLGAPLTKSEVAMIDKLRIGDFFELSASAGDACNVCKFVYRKVSETEIQPTGDVKCSVHTCTVPWPPEKYKE